MAEPQVAFGELKKGDIVHVRLTVRELVAESGNELYIRTEASLPNLRMSFWVRRSDIVKLEKRAA